MTPLDNLYGPGTLGGLTAANPVPSAQQEIEVGPEVCMDGSVWTEFRWAEGGSPVARCVICFYPEHVLYSKLEVEPDRQGEGIYTALLLNHSAWLREHGVKAMVCQPQDGHSAYVLMLGGFDWLEWEGQPWLGTDLLDTKSRVEQYRAYTAGGHEPAWHAEMIANPVP
jgi:GNAT superfamily N-acetyltransferase